MFVRHVFEYQTAFSLQKSAHAGSVPTHPSKGWKTHGREKYHLEKDKASVAVPVWAAGSAKRPSEQTQQLKKKNCLTGVQRLK